MTTRTLFLGAWITVAACAQEFPKAQEVSPPPQAVVPPEGLKLEGQDLVISRSKQFRITGGASSDRGSAASLAEDAKSELMRLIEEKEEWKVPVSIALHGKSGDASPPRTLATQIFFSEAGYSVRLDAHLGRGLESEPFKRAITAALIYERSLRRLSGESLEPFLVPPWLVGGLREASAWQLGQSDRRLYEALFKTGGLFKLEELFSLDERQYEELDAATRAAFHVSSGALVMALLQQSEGKQGFRAFLAEVASYQGEMPVLLRRHFPELNLSETSLSKWWALQLANIGGQNLLTDVLTIARTEAELAQALRLDFVDPKGVLEQKELAAWPELVALSEPQRVRAVQLAQEALVRLSYRCFPSYRPILAEYQLVLTAIALNSTADIPARLAQLGARRATMVAKALRARDYLGNFEITRAVETSGAFNDYIRLKEQLKANPHRRADSLSKYLDRMDAIFSRGQVNSVSSAAAPLNLEFPK